jgi:hypothetical protein
MPRSSSARDRLSARGLVSLAYEIKTPGSGIDVSSLLMIARSEVEPKLGRLMEATPPWVEDPLRR